MLEITSKQLKDAQELFQSKLDDIERLEIRIQRQEKTIITLDDIIESKNIELEKYISENKKLNKTLKEQNCTMQAVLEKLNCTLKRVKSTNVILTGDNILDVSI